MARIYVGDWMRVLPELGDGRALIRLARDLDISYSHVHHLVSEFVVRGWAVMSKSGRKNVYSLTDDGLELARLCSLLIKKSGGRGVRGPTRLSRNG